MIDVVALLERLEIRYDRRGRRLWAVCPNPEHDDHDPSWSIFDDPEGERHGRHHCFGCGWGGGPASLAAKVLDVPIKRAKEWLRGEEIESPILGIELEVREEQHELEQAFVLPRGVKCLPLTKWSTPARRYALQRGLTAEVVDEWGLGYAGTGELAGRLVIPVRDDLGRLVSWVARSFTGHRSKYMTPGTHTTRDVLFGAELWPLRELRKTSPVVVVEGTFDAIAVRSETGLPVAALLGSDPTTKHLLALSLFHTVVSLTDPDAAGDKAADVLRGLARWTSYHRVRLSGGDPAESRHEIRSALESVIGSISQWLDGKPDSS